MQINNFERRNYFLWFVMAFQSGVINAGGFLACHRFVTHTTGFATHFAVEFANSSFLHAAGMLSVPIFFLLGAMLAAFLVELKKIRGQSPYYALVFLLIALLMLYVVLAGSSGVFGIFGAEIQISKAYYLLAALSMASGLQNAIIHPGRGSAIRTTHLTGLTTDMGVGLVRMLSKALAIEQKKEEVLFNWIRISIIVSFILGSTLSSYLFYQVQYLAFVVPAFISFSVFCYLQWLKK